MTGRNDGVFGVLIDAMRTGQFSSWAFAGQGRLVERLALARRADRSRVDGVAAQAAASRRNPTPGTSQPDPPNLADRITLTGCVQMAPGRSAAAPDSNTPSDTRFVLTSAERQGAVPAGTGGSAVAASVSGRTYRLEAIESQLSAFVGTKVEISGQIKPRPAASRGEGAGSNVATLQVEFVQKIAAACSQPAGRPDRPLNSIVCLIVFTGARRGALPSNVRCWRSIAVAVWPCAASRPMRGPSSRRASTRRILAGRDGARPTDPAVQFVVGPAASAWFATAWSCRRFSQPGKLDRLLRRAGPARAGVRTRLRRKPPLLRNFTNAAATVVGALRSDWCRIRDRRSGHALRFALGRCGQSGFIAQPFTNHNGGSLVSTGRMLYIGMGDGGRATIPIIARRIRLNCWARCCAST